MEQIGRLLKDEEQRFIGFTEIEARTTELGFPMSVRTLRFYVDEGILPPPKRTGKAPVYDEEWILNVLLAIHIMKTRLNRSHREIRMILRNMTESPAVLADKLSVLYEDCAKGTALKPVQRDWLIEAFFQRLAGGAEGELQQASAVSLSRLVAAVEEHGRWRSTERGPVWDPPPAAALVEPGVGRLVIVKKREAPRPGGEESLPSRSAPAAALEAPGDEEPDAIREAPKPLPPGAVSLVEARAREDFFLSRFELEFDSLLQIVNPLTGKLLALGPKACAPLKRDHSASIIQRMKGRHIYDRELLDAIPLERAAEVHIYKRSFFGRGELQLVVAALTLSPIDEFLEKRHGTQLLGSLDVQRALAELVIQPGIFYVVGVFATTGWSAEAVSRIGQEPNLLCCLIEKGMKAGWRVHGTGDERWDELGGMSRLFDPESNGEKVDRIRVYLQDHPQLSLRGGHLVIDNIVEDLGLPMTLIRQSLKELLERDAGLSIQVIAGHEIVKRSRF